MLTLRHAFERGPFRRGDRPAGEAPRQPFRKHHPPRHVQRRPATRTGRCMRVAATMIEMDPRPSLAAGPIWGRFLPGRRVPWARTRFGLRARPAQTLVFHAAALPGAKPADERRPSLHRNSKPENNMRTELHFEAPSSYRPATSTPPDTTNRPAPGYRPVATPAAASRNRPPASTRGTVLVSGFVKPWPSSPADQCESGGQPRRRKTRPTA